MLNFYYHAYYSLLNSSRGNRPYVVGEIGKLVRQLKVQRILSITNNQREIEPMSRIGQSNAGRRVRDLLTGTIAPTNDGAVEQNQDGLRTAEQNLMKGVVPV